VQKRERERLQAERQQEKVERRDRRRERKLAGESGVEESEIAAVDPGLQPLEPERLEPEPLETEL